MIKINKFKIVVLVGVMLFMSFVNPSEKNINVYLIGDSTISIKEKKAYPETGWGMPFANFFDSTVVVHNLAKNGRSTRTFLNEKLWEPALKNLKTGDFVFIQFGHNDESKEKVDRYTTPAEYEANLTKFVNETKSKNAIPILVTPVSRRNFDAEGNIKETHAIYAEIVIALAKKLDVKLIDLNKTSKALYQQMGAENSKLLFNQLLPNEHPNYPDGKVDNTHFNELGARRIAQLVLADIRNLNIELANRVVKSNLPKK